MNSLSLVALNKVRLSICGDNVIYTSIGKCILLSDVSNIKNIGIVVFIITFADPWLLICLPTNNVHKEFFEQLHFLIFSTDVESLFWEYAFQVQSSNKGFLHPFVHATSFQREEKQFFGCISKTGVWQRCYL